MTSALRARPVLEVRNACKRFGAVVALDGVTFDVAPGEVLALLGDNGAGKSTLIKAISGVHRLDSGSVTLAGVDITSTTAMTVREQGVETVYQDLALFDNLTAREHLTFVGRMYGLPPDTIRKRSDELLAAAGEMGLYYAAILDD